MFKYNSATGQFFARDIDTAALTVGYSGTGQGRNNPAMESVQNVGPTPRGKYRIGSAYDDPHLGPVVMHLDPEDGTKTFGRMLFRIHGDNAIHDASHGCIILPRPVREMIAASGEHELVVV